MVDIGNLFVAFPLSALAPSVVLCTMGAMKRSWPCFAAALFWIGYCVYEFRVAHGASCFGGDCNARQDLTMIYPPLVALTLLALLDFMMRKTKTATKLKSAQA